ncbi:hypothetical protein CIW51_18990 [Mycolicibacterium sp. P9-22]|nr:hypothetical protein CIW51_18990 [Mycolicibacterium sp. P9-22]
MCGAEAEICTADCGPMQPGGLARLTVPDDGRRVSCRQSLILSDLTDDDLRIVTVASDDGSR